MSIHLLTIDGQNDFAHPKGSLFVPGAQADMSRLAVFIHRNLKKIDQIHATLDSHQVLHIAHPLFWTDSAGKSPDPFTQITTDDVSNGKWTSRHPGWRQAAQAYVEALETNKRYPLIIWPVHCRIGSWGHSLVEELDEAFRTWENEFNRVNFVSKGSNMLTEHYSAVKADVPDAGDVSTHLNTELIGLLADDSVKQILITGEALSHCVANTVRDIATAFGDDNVRKFVLLRDTCSSVPGFEHLGEDFVKELSAKGMQVTTTQDWV